MFHNFRHLNIQQLKKSPKNIRGKDKNIGVRMSLMTTKIVGLMVAEGHLFVLNVLFQVKQKMLSSHAWDINHMSFHELMC